ncbi:MAG TPA: 16S rRNA (cytidine(1402)-2'-O)-methyltransferase [Anaerolineae bacterium]|nr:16S rRNA (cytidine(1402)-2'-O)-methyltransferase [Anaerolineae bacterium]HIQ04225.1 16S rRNA (cytidine(1402)-2'-O)-methyltransferase [Anaerolineae bacterium]
MGCLYLVGTPIGNLEDITLRALRVLRAVDLIAAEDTRTTRTLLLHYEIHTPMVSYYEQGRPGELNRLLSALAQGDVALVSEAGMPGLSDPGYELVSAALAAGHDVVPIPGPTAPITALVVSGLPTDRFRYVGFLPRKATNRRRLLQEIADDPDTLVAFEAPHRLQASLMDILEILGDRPIAVARELTKLHEEIWRGTVQGALEHFTEHPPRGEFTLVVGGACEHAIEGDWSPNRVRQAVAVLEEENIERPQAIRLVAKLAGWRKRDVYRLIHIHSLGGENDLS